MKHAKEKISTKGRSPSGRKSLKMFFSTFISSIPHQKHILVSSIKYTIFLTLGVFLFFNIFLSQLISPMYFQIMNDDQKAAVSYLQSIRNLPQFSLELSRLKNIYGNGIQNAVYSKEIEEKRMIKYYEQILKDNPYSRDVLYSLFLLNERIGNKKMAADYLQRATKVDPMIK